MNKSKSANIFGKASKAGKVEQESSFPDERKIKVLFDAAIIIADFQNKDGGGRAGIFFVAYNLLCEMQKRGDLEVYLYSSMRTLSPKYVESIMPNEVKAPMYRRPTLLDRLLAMAEYKYRTRTASSKSSKNWDKAGVLSAFKAKLMATAKKCVAAGAWQTRKLLDIYDGLTGAVSGFDVYFSPMYSVPFSIRKNKSIKAYVVLHDVIPIVLSDTSSAFVRKDNWFAQLIKQMKADKDIHYFANSEYTKADFIKHVPGANGERISVALLAADSGFCPCTEPAKIKAVRKKYAIPENKRYYLSLCTFDPRKNLFFAARNFLRFIEKNRIEDLLLVLAGGHWEIFSGSIALELSNMDYGGHLVQTGYIDDEDMNALYSGAECFVFTSLYEGFGIPPLEAMQCGTPVISSNVTSLPEVTGDAALTVSPTNDEELISAYEEIYFHKSLRQKLSRKGIERAKLFSWEKTVSLFVNKFKEDMKKTNVR